MMTGLKVDSLLDLLDDTDVHHTHSSTHTLFDDCDFLGSLDLPPLPSFTDIGSLLEQFEETEKLMLNTFNQFNNSSSNSDGHQQQQQSSLLNVETQTAMAIKVNGHHGHGHGKKHRKKHSNSSMMSKSPLQKSTSANRIKHNNSNGNGHREKQHRSSSKPHQGISLLVKRPAKSMAKMSLLSASQKSSPSSVMAINGINVNHQSSMAIAPRQHVNAMQLQQQQLMMFARQLDHDYACYGE